MRLLRYVAFFLPTMLATPALDATWQELQLACQSDEAICDAYMMGVMEALVMTNAAKRDGESLEVYCIPPPGISYQTFKAAVDQLLREQPKARTMQAGAIGHIALAREFGC